MINKNISYGFLASMLLIAVSVFAICGTELTTFSDSSYSKLILFPVGGNSDTTAKISMPLDMTVEEARVNVTGINVSFTTERKLDVSVVNDVSGSMDDNCGPDGAAQPGETPCKINNLKNASKLFVNLMLSSSDNNISMVSYSSQVVNFSALTKDNISLINQIDTYKATGETCIACGIVKGIELLAEGTNPNKVIVIITDGNANRCTPGYTGFCTEKSAKAEAIAKAEEAWETHSIKIYGISFVNGVDTDTMQKIAEAGNGIYYFVNETASVADIYYEIAVELTTVYPTDPSLDIGDDADAEWSYSGEFKTTEQVDFKDELNDLLQTCSCPGCQVVGGNCTIDFNVTSKTTGKILLDDLYILYHPTYDYTCDGIDDDCDGINDDDYINDTCGDDNCTGIRYCIQDGVLDEGLAHEACQSPYGVDVNGTDCGVCCICVDIYDSYEVFESTADDCNILNLLEIDTCTWNPDSKPYTWDYALENLSYCVDIGVCKDVSYTYTHRCSDNDSGDGVSEDKLCYAECDQNTDCGDKCVGEVRWSGGLCDLAGTCNCSWIKYDCNNEDYSHKTDIHCYSGHIYNFYQDWTCSGGSCAYTGSDWPWTINYTCTDDCADTDGGIDYIIKGTATDRELCDLENQTECPSKDFTDYCTDDSLTEYYCDSGDAYNVTKDCNDYDDDFSTGYHCDASLGNIYYYYENWTCITGACQDSGSEWKDGLKEECFDDCSDSDGGQTYFTRGIVDDSELCDSSIQTDCPPNTTYEDYCTGPDTLNEYYCSGEDYTSEIINCDDFDCLTPSTLICIGEGSNTIYEQGDDYACSAGACNISGTTTCEGPWTCNESTVCGLQYCGDGDLGCYFDEGFEWGAYPDTETDCSDGYDNDCDGDIDCADSDCFGVDLKTICGDPKCPGTLICNSVPGSNTWYCSSNGTECTRSLYCEDSSVCDGHALYAVCDIDGHCGNETHTDNSDDSGCNDEDCGVCCTCDYDGTRNYDETQDSDCSATPCPDSCDIDTDLYTWDFADDVLNYCNAIDSCTSNLCDYQHVCRDDDPHDGTSDTCNAECDQHTDCQPYISGDYCNYNGLCNLSLCSCSHDYEYCPPPGTVDEGLCYYGIRECDDTGCSLDTCILKERQICHYLEGCKDVPCIPIDDITVFADKNTSFSVTINGMSSNSSAKVIIPHIDIINITAAKVDLNGSLVYLAPEKQLDIVVVTDVSGSMDNNCGPDGAAQPGETPCKINDVKAAAIRFVDVTLNLPNNNVGLVSYSTHIVNFSALTRDNISLIDQIETYRAAGETCISCGIGKAAELINEGENPTKAILVMSDGKANRCTPETTFCTEKSAKNEAIDKAREAFEAHNITVYAVAYGDDADKETMQKIASVGGGEYFFAETTNITDVYISIISKITETYPTDPALDVGSNSILEWEYISEFNTTDTAYFTEELNSLLDCTCPGCTKIGDNCTIDMKMISNTSGKIIFDNLLIESCIYSTGCFNCSDCSGNENCTDYSYSNWSCDWESACDEEVLCLRNVTVVEHICNDPGIYGTCTTLTTYDVETMTETRDQTGIVCGYTVCPVPGCVGSNWTIYPAGGDDVCAGGTCQAYQCIPAESYYDSKCINDSDADGIPDLDDACPLVYGLDCNGCPDPCTGCAVIDCPVTGPPVCQEDDSQCLPAICPADGCGLDTCNHSQWADYPDSVPNTCTIINTTGTCTDNTCIGTATCTYNDSCLGPHPLIISPDNDTLFSNETMIWAIEKTGVEVDAALFEYSADEVIWNFTGIDYDPFDNIIPFGGNTTNGRGGFGWKVNWLITPDMSEGWYYLRVTMNNSAGLTGKDQIQLYYEPTPPIPKIYEPENVATISGIVNFSAVTADENVVYMEMERMNASGDWQTKETENKTLGKLCQRTVFNNSQYNDGQNYCGPTAAANCLHYFNATHPQLFNNTTPEEVAEMLANETYMNTSKDYGTMNGDFQEGLEKYIGEHGDSLVVKHRGIKYYDDGTVKNEINFSWAQAEFTECEDVIVLVAKWNSSGSDGIDGTPDDEYLEGHFMPLSAVNHRTKKVKFRDSDCTGTANDTAEIQWRDNGDRNVSQINYSGEWRDVLDVWAVSPKERRNGTTIGTDTDATGGWSVSWDTAEVENGYYLIRATMFDADGFTGSDKIVVYINNTQYSPVYGLLVSTDNETYLGCENVTITGIVKDSLGNPVVDEDVTVQIDNSTGGTIFITQIKTDGTGNFTINFTLPCDAVNGTYTVYVSSGGLHNTTDFEVMIKSPEHILFSGVLYDTPGNETQQEWVALYNPTDIVWNLSGFIIGNNAANYTIPGGTFIAPNTTLIIAENATAFEVLHGFMPDIEGFTITLNNSGDYLELYQNGSLIDEVAWEGGYGSKYTGWNITADKGESIQRIPPSQDTDTVDDWHVMAISIIDMFEMEISAGWNIISIPLILSNTSIESVLSSIGGSYDIVRHYDAETGGWSTYDPALPAMSDLTEIDENMGFWINMTQADNLSITGLVPATTEMPVYAGWNMIGFPSLADQSLPGALAVIDGNYLIIRTYYDGGWKSYDPLNPGFSDMASMSPGEGYWLSMLVGDTLEIVNTG